MSGVHRRPTVDTRSRLADDSATQGIGDERRDRVEKRRDGLLPQSVVLALVEVEKRSDGRIRDVVDNMPAVLAVNQQLREGSQGDWSGLLEERVDGALQDVLRPRENDLPIRLETVY